MPKAESSLIDAIKQYVRELHRQGEPIKCIKIHGNQYTEAGTPDLHITWRGQSYWLEAKVGDNQPSRIQQVRLREWAAAGGIAGIVRSVEDVKAMLGTE